jgi:uncharacterized membrane protein
MPFCPNCGTEAQGAFCAKCGTQISGTGAPAGEAPPPPSASAAQAGLQENVAALLCYVLTILSGILFLVLEPYNRNKTIRFHAFQSIFFFVALMVCYIALSVIGMLPVIGLVTIPLYLVLWVASLIIWIMLMVKAYNGQRWVLPIIGPLAEKQA